MSHEGEPPNTWLSQLTDLHRFRRGIKSQNHVVNHTAEDEADGSETSSRSR
jgi:hypothetical protein